jgi:hypothetical protein
MDRQPFAWGQYRGNANCRTDGSTVDASLSQYQSRRGKSRIVARCHDKICMMDVYAQSYFITVLYVVLLLLVCDSSFEVRRGAVFPGFFGVDSLILMISFYHTVTVLLGR